MTILVLYGTVEGHTAKIARKIADQIEAAGHLVVLADVREPGFAVPGRFDAAVLCAPIHMGQYPAPMVQFIEDFVDALNDIPTALVTVSLAAASEIDEERTEAQAYPYQLSEQTGWVPAMRHNAAGALKYIEYNYFKRLVMRRMVKHAGAPVDISKDHDLTDWNGVANFVREFLADAFSGKPNKDKAVAG